MSNGSTKPFLIGILLGAIPLAMLWIENGRLKDRLTRLEQNKPHGTNSFARTSLLGGKTPSKKLPHVSAKNVQAETLISAMGSAEFRGIDFSNLPTDQEGIDEIFTKIFSETSQTDRKRLFALLLDSITPEQAPLLVKSMRLRGRLGVPGHEEYRWLLDRWGDIDGEAATAWAFKIDGDDGFKATHCTNIVIKAWTRNEPQAAVAWLAAQKDIPLKNGMREGLLNGIMDYHPDEANALLDAMEATSNERLQANKLRATRISRMEGAEELDQWFASLPVNTPNRGEIEKHVTQIHLDHGVAHAVDWAASDETRLTEVLDHYAKHSPEPLFEYYVGESGEVNPQAKSALEKAAAKWTKSNPDLMGVWLRDHMGSPNYQEIASLFVDAIKPIDPEAAKAWAETIAP